MLTYVPSAHEWVQFQRLKKLLYADAETALTACDIV